MRRQLGSCLQTIITSFRCLQHVEVWTDIQDKVTDTFITFQQYNKQYKIKVIQENVILLLHHVFRLTVQLCICLHSASYICQQEGNYITGVFTSFRMLYKCWICCAPVVHLLQYSVHCCIYVGVLNELLYKCWDDMCTVLQTLWCSVYCCTNVEVICVLFYSSWGSL